MKTLVAGIGNIFMGDDAFGCEVASELRGGDLPPDVEVADFGIRGLDLGYALASGEYERAILIDAVARGGKPGTLYVIEPEVAPGAGPAVPHGMDPVRVLRFAAAQSERLPRVLLVACEPEYLGGEEGHIGFSTAVAGAIEQAAAQVLELLANGERGQEAPALPAEMSNNGAAALQEA
jgi:hydrogenase maturation protease